METSPRIVRISRVGKRPGERYDESQQTNSEARRPSLFERLGANEDLRTGEFDGEALLLRELAVESNVPVEAEVSKSWGIPECGLNNTEGDVLPTTTALRPFAQKHKMSSCFSHQKGRAERSREIARSARAVRRSVPRCAFPSLETTGRVSSTRFRLWRVPNVLEHVSLYSSPKQRSEKRKALYHSQTRRVELLNRYRVSWTPLRLARRPL